MKETVVIGDGFELEINLYSKYVRILLL